MMGRSSFLVGFLLVFLLCVPFVLGDLVVSPSNSVVSTEWYKPYNFNVSVLNNGSVDLFNLVWSNVSYFTFPVGMNLSVNESKVVSVGVFTNELFSNRVFVSKLSGFYKVPFTPSSNVTVVNITSSGFEPSSFVIRQNDSVVWVNKMASAVEVRDLGSGFGQVNVPALGNVSVQYGVLKDSFSFYCSPQGFTGGFSVLERVNWTFEHDSSLDKNVQFTLSSVLPPSSMQINLLSSNISVGNNQTYVEALIEVRNLDPYLVIQNVSVRSDRWTSNFTPNGFNLPAGGIQRVLFNITPLVSKTNDTNRTQVVKLTVGSNNAGSTIKNVDVFIPYQNMDVVNINGTVYTITVLGVNETAEACRQHRINLGVYDRGFESCVFLEVPVNVTIVKEVMANYEFSEAEIKSIKSSMITAGDVNTRLENKMNLYVDKQDGINGKVDNMTLRFENLSSWVLEVEAGRDRVVRSHNIRFWVIFSLVVGIGLLWFVLWLADNVSYFNAMEEACQV